MLKRVLLLAIVATLNSYTYAQSISQLNSALSASTTNPVIVQKISPIRYVGKDTNVNKINNILANKTIC